MFWIYSEEDFVLFGDPLVEMERLELQEVREVKISAGKEDLYLKKCFHVYNQIIFFKTI